MVMNNPQIFCAIYCLEFVRFSKSNREGAITTTPSNTSSKLFQTSQS